MYHILVAEDEQWIRSTLAEKIERTGTQYKVVAEAADGEAAWQMIEELWPSIVFADIMMPQMDGLSLVQRIHERQLPIVPVIVSGYDRFSYAQKAMKYGVSDYLLKPITDEDLEQALTNSVRRLGDMKENRQFLGEIQTFLESMEEADPATVLHQLESLIRDIIDFGKKNAGADRGLLRVLAGRIEDRVQAYEYAGETKADDQSYGDEAIIQQRMRDKMLLWLRDRKDGKSSKQSIRQAYEYMKSNYMLDLNVSEVAGQAGLSLSHFSLLLKQHTGLPFVHTLNQIRVSRAKQLLVEQDLKVFEVAEMVGFNSLPHFIKLFKQDTGMTPNEFRKGLGI